jgi:hypothetical protein
MRSDIKRNCTALVSVTTCSIATLNRNARIILILSGRLGPLPDLSWGVIKPIIDRITVQGAELVIFFEVAMNHAVSPHISRLYLKAGTKNGSRC